MKANRTDIYLDEEAAQPMFEKGFQHSRNTVQMTPIPRTIGSIVLLVLNVAFLAVNLLVSLPPRGVESPIVAQQLLSYCKEEPDPALSTVLVARLVWLTSPKSTRRWKC